MTGQSSVLATKKFRVAPTSALTEKGRILVEVAGRSIGIYRVGDNFYALANRCPHLGGPLCRGDIVPEISANEPGNVHANYANFYVTCPWHNWEFDVKTGQSYWNPRLRALPYAVTVEGAEEVANYSCVESAERLPGPYNVETFPVEIADDYIVLALRA